MQASCDLGSFCLNGLLFVYFGSHFFFVLVGLWGVGGCVSCGFACICFFSERKDM